VRLFRRIKDPVDGIAQVVSHTQFPGGATITNVEMTLVVQAPGVEPFTLRHECMCRAKKWPTAGQSLPVTFDREHPDRLDVHWDRVPTGEETAMQSAEALRDALAGGQQTSFPQAAAGQPQVIDLTGDPAARNAMLGAVEAATGQDLDGDGKIAGAPAAGAQGDDRLADLERLARLRETGALSDAEFEAEKRRLLGS
jgi:hypothetical protein